MATTLECLANTESASNCPCPDSDFHLYVPARLFQVSRPITLVQGATSSAIVPNSADMKHVIDRVHFHVCVHSSYSDMQVLLSRNRFWYDNTGKYLTELITPCGACQAAPRPKISRKVSLSSLYGDSKKLVCAEHCFIDGVPVFHSMDAGSR